MDHLGFGVKKGEIFGFLGPNGAGKTTTLRMLTGILSPDEGEARILGVNVLIDPLTVKRIIGVVPEVCNVYTDLSAWDNMMIIGKLYGVKKQERVKQAHKWLDWP